MAAAQRCDGPHCPTIIPLANDDAVQLDIPGVPFHLFCTLHCLTVWVQHHGPTGFREIRREPRMVEYG